METKGRTLEEIAERWMRLVHACDLGRRQNDIARKRSV